MKAKWIEDAADDSLGLNFNSLRIGGNSCPDLDTKQTLVFGPPAASETCSSGADAAFSEDSDAGRTRVSPNSAIHSALSTPSPPP
ncbi:hypothetical protein ON010_g17237 [Phytophthora cinnamomi]|nr:hypothetical protein ON010_g17237 [Phytophthora cinnamomi]